LRKTRGGVVLFGIWRNKMSWRFVVSDKSAELMEEVVPMFAPCFCVILCHTKINSGIVTDTHLTFYGQMILPNRVCVPSFCQS
jgi:hypothetical protein